MEPTSSDYPSGQTEIIMAKRKKTETQFVLHNFNRAQLTRHNSILIKPFPYNEKINQTEKNKQRIKCREKKARLDY